MYAGLFPSSTNKIIYSFLLRSSSCKISTRVRFAPSPTGHIHLGGLRTAFYNYIFAKQNNGQFILRLEDTDRSRFVEGSAEEIQNILEWAGLVPDESPRIGGPYGPYKQSERLELYHEKAQHLLEKGRAYRCFCSHVRLDLLRKQQTKNREKPHYDGKCRHLSPDKIEQKLQENEGKFVIRFALAEGETTFEDMVFGRITNNLVGVRESDPVIIKTDKYPTYHFANVVDDNAMQITNVIRGAEWLSSTAKHIQIYQAFGWKPPQYIHFPLITMHDGAKMSKRCNHSHVVEWKNAGYSPISLFNFLTNTGGGVPKEKQDKMDLWSMEQFIDGFSFEQITGHSGSLDMNRLRAYSSKEIHKCWLDNPDKLIDDFYQLLDVNNIKSDLGRDAMSRLISANITRLTLLSDLLSDDFAFLWTYPGLSLDLDEHKDICLRSREIIQDFIAIIKLKLDKKEFVDSLKISSSKHKISYPYYMRFLRLILTNNEKGLPLHEIVTYLGESRCIDYLNKSMELIKQTVANMTSEQDIQE